MGNSTDRPDQGTKGDPVSECGDVTKASLRAPKSATPDPRRQDDITTQRAPSKYPGSINAVTTEPNTPYALSASRGSGRPRDQQLNLSPGVVLDGKYVIQREVGAGGMGVVLLARDQSLDRNVAIKLIRPELRLEEDVRADFHDEAKAMARIRHPNVVTVHAYGEVDETPYFVMEYIAGVDVATVLRGTAGVGLAQKDACAILSQVAAGLDAIHAARAVHLDIKPGNILIGEGYRVVISDLGISRKLDQIDAEVKLAGTPHYMAPELALDTSPTPAADIYSLAVTAYQLLTGALPFSDTNPDDDCTLDEHGEPVPRLLTSALSARVDAVLMRGLAAAPLERPTTAGAFARALVAALRAKTGETPLSFFIADDDALMVTVARTMLEQAFPDAEIRTAYDGTTAFNALKQRTASLALMDLDMPGHTGFELTQALRADPATAAMPIIVMTAAGGASDWRKLAALGANAFLVKPFEGTQLELAVRRLLGILNKEVRRA